MGYDETKEEFVKRSTGRSSKVDFQEFWELDERISKEEVELLRENQNLEEMMKEKRNAKVEEREIEKKTTAKISGSRISETEAEILSARNQESNRKRRELLPMETFMTWQWRESLSCV